MNVFELEEKKLYPNKFLPINESKNQSRVSED